VVVVAVAAFRTIRNVQSAVLVVAIAAVASVLQRGSEDPKFATILGVFGGVGCWRRAGAAVCFPCRGRLGHFENRAVGACRCRRSLVVLLSGTGCVGGGAHPFFLFFFYWPPGGHVFLLFRRGQGCSFVFLSICVPLCARPLNHQQWRAGSKLLLGTGWCADRNWCVGGGVRGWSSASVQQRACVVCGPS